MHRFSAILVFTLINFSVAFGAEKTITAKFRESDPENKTITIDKLKLDVTRKTKITNDGKKIEISNIEIGQIVQVKYDDDLEVALSINVVGKDLSIEERLEKLNGTWIAFAEEGGGKRIKKAEMKTKKKTFKVDGDKFTLSTSGYKIAGKIKFILEDGPNAIDLKGSYVGESNNQAVLLKGIYDIKDQTLRICYSYNAMGLPEKERPTEFETEEGKDGLSVSFLRAE
jgi:uncharacterized protein (TIGR03067 family)